MWVSNVFLGGVELDWGRSVIVGECGKICFFFLSFVGGFSRVVRGCIFGGYFKLSFCC